MRKFAVAVVIGVVVVAIGLFVSGGPVMAGAE